MEINQIQLQQDQTPFKIPTDSDRFRPLKKSEPMFKPADGNLWRPESSSEMIRACSTTRDDLIHRNTIFIYVFYNSNNSIQYLPTTPSASTSYSRSHTSSSSFNESPKPRQPDPNQLISLKTDSRHLCYRYSSHRHRYPSHRHRYPSHRHRYPSHRQRYPSHRTSYMGHCYPDCIRKSKTKNSSSCFYKF